MRNVLLMFQGNFGHVSWNRLWSHCTSTIKVLYMWCMMWWVIILMYYIRSKSFIDQLLNIFILYHFSFVNRIHLVTVYFFVIFVCYCNYMWVHFDINPFLSHIVSNHMFCDTHLLINKIMSWSSKLRLLELWIYTTRRSMLTKYKKEDASEDKLHGNYL